MIKNCISCQTNFEITEDDLNFLDRISPVINNQKFIIPPPKFCPTCRQIRRLSFRNERKLYHRKCDLTGKDIISIYSPNKPYKVYSIDTWWSDEWDGLEYGIDFDFSRPFFEQFHELLLKVPRIALMNQKHENSEYACFAL